MSLLARLLTWLVRLYRFLISPLLGSNCRYEPSCSQYALDALDQHGAFAGAWLTLKRLGRCQPWGGYGYDPVPERTKPASCQHHFHSKP